MNRGLQRPKDSWDSIALIQKHNGAPKQRRKKGTEIVVEELMAYNFPNLMKKINLHI